MVSQGYIFSLHKGVTTHGEDRRRGGFSRRVDRRDATNSKVSIGPIPIRSKAEGRQAQVLVNHFIEDRLVVHITRLVILGRVVAREFVSQRRESQSEQAADIKIEVCMINHCHLGILDCDIGNGDVFPAEFARQNSCTIADVEIHILNLTPSEISAELRSNLAIALLWHIRNNLTRKQRPKDSYNGGSSGVIKALKPFLKDPGITRSGIQYHAIGFITPSNLSDIIGLTRVADCRETSIASGLATAEALVVTHHAVYWLQRHDIVRYKVQARCPSFEGPMGFA